MHSNHLFLDEKQKFENQNNFSEFGKQEEIEIGYKSNLKHHDNDDYEIIDFEKIISQQNDDFIFQQQSLFGDIENNNLVETISESNNQTTTTTSCSITQPSISLVMMIPVPIIFNPNNNLISLSSAPIQIPTISTTIQKSQLSIPISPTIPIRKEISKPKIPQTQKQIQFKTLLRMHKISSMAEFVRIHNSFDKKNTLDASNVRKMLLEQNDQNLRSESPAFLIAKRNLELGFYDQQLLSSLSSPEEDEK